MGLIRIGLSALGSAVNDQLKEYFRCDGMNNNTLCIPATKVLRGKAQNNGTAEYISSGSVFDVALNQAALLVEDGKVWDFVIASSNDLCGQYKFDSATAPSLFAGGSFKDNLLGSIKEIGARFAAGGQATHTMRLVYINLRPISGVPVGFGGVPFRDGEMNITLNAQGHGQMELQITDPAAFFQECIHDISRPFVSNSGDGQVLINQLKADMKPKFGVAISNLSRKGIPYDQIIAYGDDLAYEMNEALKVRWGSKGIEIKSMPIELNVDEESKKQINEFQRAKTLGSNQQMLYAMDRESINRARETAAGNSAGAMTGFMGMGFVGGNMPQPQMGMQPPPQQGYNPNGYQNQGYNPNQAYNPNQGYNPNQAYNPNPQQQAAPTQQAGASGSWKCSCGAENTGKFCINCGSPKPAPAASADGWVCAKCGSVNKGKFCMECGAQKPAAAPLYKCDKCGWEPADPKNPPKFCPQCGDPFDDNDVI